MILEWVFIVYLSIPSEVPNGYPTYNRYEARLNTQAGCDSFRAVTVKELDAIPYKFKADYQITRCEPRLAK